MEAEKFKQESDILQIRLKSRLETDTNELISLKEAQLKRNQNQLK